MWVLGMLDLAVLHVNPSAVTCVLTTNSAYSQAVQPSALWWAPVKLVITMYHCFIVMLTLYKQCNTVQRYT